MKSFIILFIAVFFLAFTSCTENKKPVQYQNVQEKVDGLSFDIQYVTQEELKSQFDNNGYFLLVDCREEDEFANGHISKAINIPRGLLEFSKKLENKNERIFIYCDSLDRAILGAEMLKKLDYKRIYVLEGGFNNWKNNYPKEVEQSEDAEEIVSESSCG